MPGRCGRLARRAAAGNIAFVAILEGERPGKPGLPLRWLLGLVGLVLVLMTGDLVRDVVTFRRWVRRLPEPCWLHLPSAAHAALL